MKAVETLQETDAAFQDAIHKGSGGFMDDEETRMFNSDGILREQHFYDKVFANAGHESLADTAKLMAQLATENDDINFDVDES